MSRCNLYLLAARRIIRVPRRRPQSTGSWFRIASSADSVGVVVQVLRGESVGHRGNLSGRAILQTQVTLISYAASQFYTAKRSPRHLHRGVELLPIPPRSSRPKRVNNCRPSGTRRTFTGPLRRPLEKKHGVGVGLGDPFPSPTPRLSHYRWGELYHTSPTRRLLNRTRSNQ